MKTCTAAILFGCFIVAACSQKEPAVVTEKPNILLIIADDLGYSDLGSYGGEIDTPNIDELADAGVRFTDFNVNPMCEVTRASLITGHTPNQSLDYAHSIPIAKLMQRAGYETFLSGKWHQPFTPIAAGFNEFYGFLNGQIDSWTGIEARKNVIQRGDQKPVAVPENWYSTDAFTDFAIESIDKSLSSGKPFFGFLSYNAPHSPLHAPQQNVEKYPERYQAGWEALRKKRFERMKSLGIVDDRFEMSEPDAEVRRWHKLDSETQHIEANRMAAYAGMVDRLDENIGRVIAHLKHTNQLDNTIIVVMSDNGGDYSNGDIANYAKQIAWQKHTRPHASNGWAYLKNTPFQLYKHTSHKGGVASPLIIHWPKKLAKLSGEVMHHRLHVTDLYPTFLALAEQPYPTEHIEPNKSAGLKPLYGKSILPLLGNPQLDKLAIHNQIFWSYRDISRGFMRDEWKIASIYDGPWALYNVQRDPTEHHNLAAVFPETVTKLSEQWFKFANQQTSIPTNYKLPIHETPIGWGFHRLKRIMPTLISTSPLMSQVDVPLNTSLVMTFSQPLDFKNTPEKPIRLYRASQPNTIVWQSDPDSANPWQGKKRIEFTDLPRLEADTTYFVLVDRGWAKSGASVLGPINDGAYWWRFRTAKAP